MARLTALLLALAAATPVASQDKADPKRVAELKDQIAAKKTELAKLEAELAKVSPPPAENPKGPQDPAVVARKAGEELYAKEVAKVQAAKKLMDEAAAKFTELADALPKQYKARLEEEFAKLDRKKELLIQAEAAMRKELDAEIEARATVERDRFQLKAQVKDLQAQLAKLLAKLKESACEPK